jgi:hypothetical protein
VSGLKPAVPDVLVELEIDREDASYKAELAKLAKRLERLLAEYQVEEYVIARRDEGSKLTLVVLPCATEPEERAPRPLPAEGDDSSAEATSARRADAIVDVMERVASEPARSSSRPADGLAPRTTQAGVGLRRKT